MLNNYAFYSRHEQSKNFIEQSRRISNKRISLNKQILDHSYNSALRSLAQDSKSIQKESSQKQIIYNRGANIDSDSDDSIFPYVSKPITKSYLQSPRSNQTDKQTNSFTPRNTTKENYSNFQQTSGQDFISNYTNDDFNQIERKLFQDFEKSLNSLQQELSEISNIFNESSLVTAASD